MKHFGWLEIEIFNFEVESGKLFLILIRTFLGVIHSKSLNANVENGFAKTDCLHQLVVVVQHEQVRQRDGCFNKLRYSPIGNYPFITVLYILGWLGILGTYVKYVVFRSYFSKSCNAFKNVGPTFVHLWGVSTNEGLTDRWMLVLSTDIFKHLGTLRYPANWMYLLAF